MCLQCIPLSMVDCSTVVSTLQACIEIHAYTKKALQTYWSDIDDGTVIAVCAVIALVAYAIFAVLAFYFGPWVTVISLALIGTAYILYQEQALQAALATQQFFQEVIRGFFTLIGDREELVQALKEANQERGLLQKQVANLQQQVEKNHQETVKKIDKVHSSMQAMYALCRAWKESGQLVAEHCYQGIEELFLQTQSLFLQGNEDLSSHMQRIEKKITAIQKDSADIKKDNKTIKSDVKEILRRLDATL
ncbi:MAG: hypothetical protein FJZ58_00415 [Chlamydiae bacterium]|nr:hypothetical protein [Chlamydiota bacterium]